MPIGFRAILDFERPPKEHVESFHGIPSSNIADCVKKMYCMFGGIRPFNQHSWYQKRHEGSESVAITYFDFSNLKYMDCTDGIICH